MALKAVGFEPGTYLPTLQKIVAMHDATPPVDVFHRLTYAKSLLPFSSAIVSEARKAAIARVLQALESGNLHAVLMDLKLPQPVAVMDALTRDPAKPTDAIPLVELATPLVGATQAQQLVTAMESKSSYRLVLAHDGPGIRTFEGETASADASAFCFASQRQCRVLVNSDDVVPQPAMSR